MSEIKNRFWEKVERGRSDECWPWGGCRNEKGYGQLVIAQQKHKAHRVALRISGTPIPKGKIVMHTCDNPPCCNPNHLKVGTQSENIKDSFSKGRRSLAGAKNPNAKLTRRDVRAIRKMYAAAPCCNDGSRKKKGSVAAIANRFGVGKGVITSIAKGKAWSHV